MAEEALYGNFQEPKFPFDRVVRHLAWLPSYLADAETSGTNGENFDALLDTVLVFGRARTAAFHSIGDFNRCQRLANALNASLKAAGRDAMHHQVELVRRGPIQFFITCKNSPRFDWNVRLTHRAVGMNLDFFAAGHMFPWPHPPRAHLSFVEHHTLESLSTECILLESLEDPKFYQQFIQFNNAKESVVNETFEKLGLRYRVKWFLNSPIERERIAAVMTSPVPPSLEWWHDNYFMLNIPGPFEKTYSVQFCTYETKYKYAWPLLQQLFFFSVKYNRYDRLRRVPDYWEHLADIFTEVRKMLSQDLSLEEVETFSANIRSQLEKVASQADIVKPEPAKGQLHHWREFSRRLRRNIYFTLLSIRYRFWLPLETLKINLFESWKLRKPLVCDRPPIPIGARTEIWL